MKHRTMLYLLVGILCLPGLTSAQGIYKPCDNFQGFQYRPHQNARVGYITNLQIEGVNELVSDITVTNPMNPGEQMRVFAVLHEVSWELAPGAPLQFAGQVSVSNKKAVDVALIMDLQNLGATFQFVVFEYDPSTKRYYKAFHSNDVMLKGQVARQGHEIALSAGDTQNSQVQSPENYAFSVAVLPAGPQQLSIAISENQKMARQWGF